MASTVVGYADMDPSPRVDITIDAADLDVSTTSITIEQVSTVGVVAVRDAELVASAGGFFITDYEMPPGESVEYRIAQYDVDGVSLGYASVSLSVQVDTDPAYAIIQDPLIPANAVSVRIERDFARELRSSRPTRVYRTGNAQTYALLGAKGFLEEIPLRCWTDTDADSDTLAVILEETQFTVRTMPVIPVPGVMHVVVPSPVRVPFDRHVGGQTDVWDLVGTQVSRTELEIIAAVVNWQRVIDYYATWSDLIADKATWLELLSDPPPEA